MNKCSRKSVLHLPVSNPPESSLRTNRVQRFRATCSCCRQSSALRSPSYLITFLSLSISLHAANVQAAARSVSISTQRVIADRFLPQRSHESVERKRRRVMAFPFIICPMPIIFIFPGNGTRKLPSRPRKAAETIRCRESGGR